MTTIAFDTLKFVHRLREAGIPEPHAEAIAVAFRDASGEADVATKADIVALRADMEILERDLTIRLGAMILAPGGFLTAVKFFGH